MASSLVFGASDGVNTVRGRLKVCAAAASARPWLPADAVTSCAGAPSGRSSSAMTALNAPRDLKEFETCSDSSFSETSAPECSDNHADRTSGVRRT